MNQARSKREINPISKGQGGYRGKRPGRRFNLRLATQWPAGKPRFTIFHFRLSLFLFELVRNVPQKLEIGEFNNNRANEPREFVRA